MKANKLFLRAILLVLLSFFATTVTNATAVSISEIKTPSGVDPGELILGTDGKMWFRSTGDAYGTVTASRKFTVYHLTGAGRINGIAFSPNGSLWFVTEYGMLYRRLPTGEVTSWQVPGGGRIFGIVAGSDGNMWFAQYDANKIDRVTSTGEITQFNVNEPARPVLGSDGAIWFSEFYGSKIGRITTTGVVTEWALPHTGSAPLVMTVGSDGNVWVTENQGKRIARVTPTGIITEWSVENQPAGITKGSDGAIWFDMWGARQLGRMTTSGQLNVFSLASNTPSTYWGSVQFDSTGKLWIAEQGASKIAIIDFGKTYDLTTQPSLDLDFATSYDAKNAQTVTLKNTSASPISVSNVVISDAENYWVNLFMDSKLSCRAKHYTANLKNFTIPANKSCTIRIGFSPFDDLTAGKAIPATLTLKTLINGVATDKIINLTGIGRAQVANFYNNNKMLWGQASWGVSELKAGNAPINTTLVSATTGYGSAKFWYGSVINPALQKSTANIGNIVVFAQNNFNANGHVGVVIQTTPVVTMLSMNDIGAGVRKWSVRPVDWYPNATATWSPLITGFNATDVSKHYGFIMWRNKVY